MVRQSLLGEAVTTSTRWAGARVGDLHVRVVRGSILVNQMDAGRRTRLKQLGFPAEPFGPEHTELREALYELLADVRGNRTSSRFGRRLYVSAARMENASLTDSA